MYLICQIHDTGSLGIQNTIVLSLSLSKKSRTVKPQWQPNKPIAPMPPKQLLQASLNENLVLKDILFLKKNIRKQTWRQEKKKTNMCSYKVLDYCFIYVKTHCHFWWLNTTEAKGIKKYSGSKIQKSLNKKVEFGTGPWKRWGFLWAVNWTSGIPRRRNTRQKRGSWNSPVFRRCHNLTAWSEKNMSGKDGRKWGQNENLEPGIHPFPRPTTKFDIYCRQQKLFGEE